MKFHQNYHQQFKLKNRKKLAHSISIALKIVRGESTYESEKKRLD